MAKHQDGFYRRLLTCQEWKLRREYADWVCDVIVNFFPFQCISQKRHSIHLQNKKYCLPTLILSEMKSLHWKHVRQNRSSFLSSHRRLATSPPSPLLFSSPRSDDCVPWQQPGKSSNRQPVSPKRNPPQKSSSSPLSSSIHPHTTVKIHFHGMFRGEIHPSILLQTSAFP